MCQPACKKLNREPDGRRDVFSQQVGTTHARFVARLRLQAAKDRLEATTDNVEPSLLAQASGMARHCVVWCARPRQVRHRRLAQLLRCRLSALGLPLGIIDEYAGKAVEKIKATRFP